MEFWAGQVEENEFPEPGDLFKHRFLDLSKVVFRVWDTAGLLVNNNYSTPTVNYLFLGV